MRIIGGIRRAGPLGAAMAAAIALCLALRGLSSLEGLGAELRGLRDDTGAASAYAAESRAQGAAALDSLAARLDAGLEAEAAAERSIAALSSRLSALADRIDGFSRAIGEDRGPGGAKAFDAALDSRILRADEAYRSGSYGEAAIAYASLLASAPEEDIFLERRAISRYRANPADSDNYAEVERDLASLLSRGAGGEDALETLALISIERGEWARALEGYEYLLRSRPGDLDILVAACDCALFAGDEAAAARFLGLARLPERPDARSRLELERIRSRLPGGGGPAR